jgi:hypothetical protein
MCAQSGRLFLLAWHSDFVVYDPQGIGVWNGAYWSWFHRFQDDYIADIQIMGDALWALHRDGALSKLDGKQIETYKMPSFAELTVNHFISLPQGGIQIVGNSALISQWIDGAWTYLKSPVDDSFICQAQLGKRTVLGGAKGLIHVFENGNWQTISMGFDGVITSLKPTGKTVVYGSGYDYSNESGILFALDVSKLKVVFSTRVPYGVTQLVVRSEAEVYAAAPAKGVYLWDGKQVTISIDNEHTAGLTAMYGVVRHGNDIIGFGEGNVIVSTPPNWSTVAIQLDESYLGR